MNIYKVECHMRSYDAQEKSLLVVATTPIKAIEKVKAHYRRNYPYLKVKGLSTEHENVLVSK